jgi:nitric oxide reductase NorE protein
MTELANTRSQPPRNRVRFVPGQPDMWAFVLFEALVFTSYFVVYMISRTAHPEVFLRSQEQLDLRIGVFETLVLVLSSYSMARCVQTSRAGVFRSAFANILAATALGVVFLVSKVSEWTKYIRNGFGFSTNEFFQYYYFLTGIHFLHLLIGFVALGVAVYQLRSPLRRSQELVETSATYWHTVDFLWIVIFALLYVVR